MVRAGGGAASLFCLDIESAKMEKCEKNGFFFLIFKSMFILPGRRKEEGSSLCHSQDVCTFTRVVVLHVPTNTGARAGCGGTNNQRAAPRA